MKILGKISINPEKVIKNEELVNLRGGYSHCNCTISWPNGDQTSTSGYYGVSTSSSTCAQYMEQDPMYDGCSIECE